MLIALAFAVVAANVTFDPLALHRAGNSERVAAAVDHDAVVSVSKSCRLTADEQAVNVPRYLLSMAAYEATNATSNAVDAATKLVAPSYILAAVTVSHQIGWARVALAEKEWWTSLSMQIFQWLVVLIGVIRTVLISIKAILSERSGTNVRIGIAAIILSTVGTSIATMNSFYSPRVTHDRDERSLQALRTLHWQLATGIMREDAVCEKLAWPPDWRYKRIKAISDQYTALMNAVDIPAEAGEDGKPDQNGTTRAVQTQ